MIDYVAVIATFTALVGFPALVAAIVNILKVLGVVVDGDASKWVAGFNVLGLILVLVTRTFFPALAFEALDAQLGGMALFLTTILSFVVQMGVSKSAHESLKGLPVVGKSFSGAKAKE